MNKEMLQTLVGKVVKVDRGGPESRIGKLLHVAEDFFTVLTEDDGVVYYRTQHVKSLTENSKSGLQFDVEIPEVFNYITGENFDALMGNLQYQWVNINRGGPEKLDGVLHSINDDYLTIVKNEEVIRLATYHVKNISYGLKIEKPEETSNENEDNKSKGKNKKDK
jgi:spore coat protein B